jgi:DNA-binding YbaB/EbfC family protein
MDINDIMRLAGQLREQLASPQNEVVDVKVRGEAGGGLVEVVMNGKYEALEVHIDPRALVPSEVALLEDLLRAAINQAATKVSDTVRDRMGDLGRRLGLDPSLLRGDKPGGG